MADARKRAEEALARYDKIRSRPLSEWRWDCFEACIDALRALLAETAPAPPQAREVEAAAERLRATHAEIARLDERDVASAYPALRTLLPRVLSDGKALLAALARGGWRVTLTELLAEAKRLESPDWTGPSGQRDLFYAKHGPRLVRVAEAAMRMRGWLDAASASTELVAAHEAFDAEVRGEKP